MGAAGASGNRREESAKDPSVTAAHAADDHQAATANLAAYREGPVVYDDGAPHLNHAGVRALFCELARTAWAEALRSCETPRVFDLGAGEGSATMPFLTLGARVTAVDSSAAELDALRKKAERFGDRLDVRCEDVSDALAAMRDEYDIVVASSFLHHVPDYLGLLSRAVARLSPHGQFLSFQDPMRYDSAWDAAQGVLRSRLSVVASHQGRCCRWPRTSPATKARHLSGRLGARQRRVPCDPERSRSGSDPEAAAQGGAGLQDHPVLQHPERCLPGDRVSFGRQEHLRRPRQTAAGGTRASRGWRGPRAPARMARHDSPHCSPAVAQGAAPDGGRSVLPGLPRPGHAAA